MRILIALFSLLILLTLSSVTFFSKPSPTQNPKTITNPLTGKQQIAIKGFTYTFTGNNKPLIKISATELAVKPRRFFVFNIRSVNKAFITEPLIEYYPQENQSIKTRLFNLEEILPFSKTTRKSANREIPDSSISRIQLDDVRLNVIHDNNVTLSLVADKGMSENGQQGVNFFNATLHNQPATKSIRSRKITWDIGRELFLIPDYYQMYDDGVRTEGRSIQVNMDFTVSPYTP